ALPVAYERALRAGLSDRVVGGGAATDARAGAGA
ncbi:MAG: hypothetical protein JWP05_1233, partial [Microbacteriaceae bacterium]|nr:hypothetical protein [Microbacteriaceae bacterium]